MLLLFKKICVIHAQLQENVCIDVG